MLIETQIPGIVNHADMNGLGNDDHPQYLLADGTRAMQDCIVNDTVYCENISCNATVNCGEITTGANCDVNIGEGGQLVLNASSIYWDENTGKLVLNSNNELAIYSYYPIEINASDDVRIVSSYMDVEISAPSGKVTISDLEAPDGIYIGTGTAMQIYDSTGDMYFTSPYAFVFDGQYALHSTGGFRSSAGYDGITQDVDYSDGTMYFEDGLLVFVNNF